MKYMVTICMLSMMFCWICLGTLAQTAEDWAQKEQAWKEKAKDAYVFPVRPGMPEWAKFESGTEMAEACQIPEDILKTISTAGLVETCLNYPFLGDITATDTYQQGIEGVTMTFNGLQELFKRPDAGMMLIERYATMDPETKYQGWSSHQERDYPSFEFLYLEVMLAQDAVLENMLREAKILLLQESLRVFRAKQNSKHYAEHTFMLPVRLMAKVLEILDKEPLHQRIAAIPPEDEETVRRQILEKRPDMKNVAFTPILVPISDQYQSFLRGGYYGSEQIPQAIVLSVEQYLHVTK
jgi:hypothetical protein